MGLRLVHRPDRIRGLRPPFLCLGFSVKRIIEISLIGLVAVLGGWMVSFQVHANDGSKMDGQYYYVKDMHASTPASTATGACENAAPYMKKPMSVHDYTLEAVEEYWPAGGEPYRCHFKSWNEAYLYWMDKYLPVIRSGCDDSEELASACGGDCPAAGEVKRLTYTYNDSPGQFVDGVFTMEIRNGADGNASMVFENCAYNKAANPNVKCRAFGVVDGGGTAWKCSADYVSVGAEGTAAVGSDITVEGGDTASGGSLDTRKNSVEKSVDGPTTETVGDKQVTTKTDTTIEKRGDGTVVKQVVNNYEITKSGGITKTTTTTTTTVINNDGSKTVTEVKNVSYEGDKKVVYNIQHEGDRIIVNQIPGVGPLTSETKTVTNYGGDGNMQDQVIQSSGGGGGGGDGGGIPDLPPPGEPDSEEKSCEEDSAQDKCVGDFEKGNGGEFGDISAKLEDARDEYQQQWDSIREEAKQKLGFSVSSGGTVTDNNVVIRGVEGNIGITKWFPHFDNFGLGDLILLAAVLIAIIILLRS